jgi:8-oxo-dGTP pyrophosphatase MutT (NUDIX family)
LSREAPFGATVIVAAASPEGWRLLLLHRAHRGPDYDGDWAWTPPSGGRAPGEPVIACARRELLEETGIDADPVPVRTEATDWAVFRLEVSWGLPVRMIDDEEHDRYEWVSVENALSRCRPAAVAEGIILAMEGL